MTPDKFIQKWSQSSLKESAAAGIAETVRPGLELAADSQACVPLRELRGEVRFSQTLTELKTGRRLRSAQAPASPTSGQNTGLLDQALQDRQVLCCPPYSLKK
jgi:hypothetical protein